VQKSQKALSGFVFSLTHYCSTEIKEGDANTALFHAHARYHKSKNFIAKVVSDDGQVLTTYEAKTTKFADFYNAMLGSLRTETQPSTWMLWGCFPMT
jgi:hypothetical protein